MPVLRILYTKEGPMKFLSHLEMIRFMERLFRRMRLPLSFSQGFNPHPKISFAAPLAVGVSSEGEVVEVELTESVDFEKVISDSKLSLPDGITLIKAQILERSGKLMSQVSAGIYKVRVDFVEEFPWQTKQKGQNALDLFLSQDHIMIKKQTKKKKWRDVDIRPLIYDVGCQTVEKSSASYTISLATGSAGNLKPEVFFESFFKAENAIELIKRLRVHRVRLLTGKTGAFIDLYDML